MATETKQQTTSTQAEIEICAYYLWEKNGRPTGRDREHWIQAETQLTAIRSQAVGESMPAAVAKPARSALKPREPIPRSKALQLSSSRV
jgi:hypothetical protein